MAKLTKKIDELLDTDRNATTKYKPHPSPAA